jgi:hypothetical protein
MGEHFHPTIEECFTVVRGRLGYRVAGRAAVAGPGVRLFVPAGMPHTFWNAGPEEALVRIEIRPGARFEAMIRTAFGLARDGRVNARGMPNLLQLSVFAQEFDDVIRFRHPPRVVQRALFGLIAPLARLLGYRGTYPEYLARDPASFVPVEPLDIDVLANGPAAHTDYLPLVSSRRPLPPKSERTFNR